MTEENKDTKKKSGRIWGWIITIIWGLYIGWIVYKLKPPYGSSYTFEELGYLFALIIPFFCGGLPILAIGLWRLLLPFEGKSRRIWGWASVLGGSVYILLDVLVVVLYLSSEPHRDPVQNQADLFSAYAPILIITLFILTIGVLFLFLGIKEIIRKGKTPPVDLYALDNPQEKVEK